MAVSHARAGRPRGGPLRHDGRPRGAPSARRSTRAGFADVPILSYAAKYASAFYGPFREAADSAPAVRRPPRLPDGPRQRPRGPARGAARRRGGRGHGDGQARAALPRRDPRRARALSTVPVAAYNVSGEYAMVKAAAAAGLDRRAAHRAGDADLDRAAPAPTSSSPTTPRTSPAGRLTARTRCEASRDDPVRGALRARAAADPGRRNSPVRAFKAVGGTPLFIAQGRRARASGTPTATRYIDYVGSWGPMILGHAHPAVVEAVHAGRAPRHVVRRALRGRGRAGRARRRASCPRSRRCASSPRAPRPP